MRLLSIAKFGYDMENRESQRHPCSPFFSLGSIEVYIVMTQFNLRLTCPIAGYIIGKTPEQLISQCTISCFGIDKEDWKNELFGPYISGRPRQRKAASW